MRDRKHLGYRVFEVLVCEFARRIPRRVTCLLAASLISTAALAQSTQQTVTGDSDKSLDLESTKPPFQLGEHLLHAKELSGDWDGTRKKLETEGVSLRLYYNQQFQQNFRGGLDTHNGHRLSGSYDVQLLFDFEKLDLWDNAGFFFGFKGTWSDGINPNKVGALSEVNSDAGDDHPVFLNKWWYWHTFLEKRVEIRAGRIQTQKDLFDTSVYANHEDKDFINRGSFRNPTIPHRNGLGAFVKVEPVPWLYLQTAAVDAQSRARRTGFDTAFHDEDRFNGYLEIGATPKWSTAKGPMPGRYRVGGWYDANPKTVFRDTLGGRREAGQRTGDVGFYAGVDQMIWKENEKSDDSQGLGVFARYGQGHSDVNRVSQYWQIGTSVRGLAPTRDQDVLAFSTAQLILSDRYGDEVRPRADRETIYECYYAWQATPWCIVSPHLQFVTNPGGDKDDRDAIIGGVRVRIIF
ncbi:MAG: carbohydrate porin [Planctomycetota bacterium]